MMNENELRIGNIVLVSNEQCHPQLKDVLMKVTSIQHRHDLPEYSVRIERVVKDKFDVNVDYGQLMRFIKPIPLTEELLLKCGFDEYMVLVTEYGELRYYGNGQMDIGGYDSCTSGMVFTSECKYLHQLQNLYFALDGNELEINL